MIRSDPGTAEVLKPYLIADDFLSTNPPMPKRFVIDFSPQTILEAEAYGPAMQRVKRMVLTARQKNAEKEEARNKEALAENPQARLNHHHRNFLRKWWLHSYPRPALLKRVRALPCYVACGQVTKRPIFVFVSSAISPNAALEVFTFADDYSFGILQSDIHWRWFVERCSTLKGDFRYTSNTVYDSFPWPQSATLGQIRGISKAATELRQFRAEVMSQRGYTLRELYRTLELPGDNPLKQSHARLARISHQRDRGQSR